MHFQGSMTAIVTPFRDGRVDERALAELIDWQIAQGIDVIVPCGTTGEGVTLADAEHARVIRVAVETAAGRAPVLAGAGSNNTARAVSLAKNAKEAGADGTLQVTPFYNKPTPEGLYEHFRAIAEAVDLPLVLYNVPGRTAVNMSAETTLRCAELENVCGIKEASGDITQIKAIAAGRPDDFAILSGEDAMNLDIYRAGGNGCISVAGNVAPDRVSAIWDRFATGEEDAAEDGQRVLAALNEAMFLVTNPIPVKTALAMMGRCREEFRLPLTPMGEEVRDELARRLRTDGLLD